MGVEFAIGVHAVLTTGHGQRNFSPDSSLAIGSSTPPDTFNTTSTDMITDLGQRLTSSSLTITTPCRMYRGVVYITYSVFHLDDLYLMLDLRRACILIIHSSSSSMASISDTASSLPPAFMDAYNFFFGKMRRTGTQGGVGLYYDRYSLQDGGSASSPISIGSTGFGMISVCIGCALGLLPKLDAIRLTLESLESLLGEQEGFTPKRSNRTKFFAHFLNPETGDAASKTTEISTVDTALMAAGAMFARNYLKDPTVEQKTNSLVQSIDWGAVVGEDPYLCMVMDPDTGNPDWSKKTRPFNEYYVLAYVGKWWKER